MTVEVALVPPENVPHAWWEARPYISRALARSMGELTPEDLFEICRSGHGALLLFVDEKDAVVGAAVTQMLNHWDGRRVCRILAYGANSWLETAHCLADVENGARRVGAHAVHFNGRMGWLKRCLAMGYKPVQVVMEKAL